MGGAVKGILIDPSMEYAREVVVDLTEGLGQVYHLLSCKSVEAGYMSPDTMVLVDEEALLKPGVKKFFSFKNDGGDTIPLAGAGLVLGVGEDGEATDCPIHIDTIRKLVFFPRVGQ